MRSLAFSSFLTYQRPLELAILLPRYDIASSLLLLPRIDIANVVLHVKEIAYAKKRMELEGREQRKPYTKAKFKKILGSWHIYGLSLLYV